MGDETPESVPCRRTPRLVVPRCACRLLITVVAITVLLFLNLLLVVRVGSRVRPEDWSQLDLSYRLPKIRDLGILPFDEGFEYNFVLDVHAHTTSSDGVLSPAQLVDYAVAEGLDGIVVTDHQFMDGALAAREYAERTYPSEIVVLPGVEYTTCRVHLNLLGIDDLSSIKHLIKPWPTDEELQEVMDQTHAAGGVAVVNHIPWSTTTLNDANVPKMTDHPSLLRMVELGADAVEVANGDTFDLQSALRVRRQSAAFAAALAPGAAAANASGSFLALSPGARNASGSILALVASSDTHRPRGHYGLTAVRLPSQRLSNGSYEGSWKDPARRAAAALHELRARRTTVLFDAVGSGHRVEPVQNEGYRWFLPLLWLHMLFEGVFYRYDRGMYDFNGGRCQPDELHIQSATFAAFVLYALLVFLAVELGCFAWKSRRSLRQRCAERCTKPCMERCWRTRSDSGSEGVLV